MIPRLKPYLGLEEIQAVVFHSGEAVRQFETAFAEAFQVRHALAFPYGRSALWAFFKAMDIQNAEVVQPAYTCSVVGHATVESGNIPVFVDISLADYNMDYEKLAQAITAKTRVVIPTHLFGYPMDINRVHAIVQDAEARFGHRIYIIQDCAHSFEAEWQGRSVIRSGDGALFGLGISKQITSIFGGMFTTDNDEIAERMRKFRDTTYAPGSWVRSLKRALYLMAVYPAFSEGIYGLVYWLQERTPLLNRLTKAYHLDQKIHLPPDFKIQMTPVEAAVGIAQLRKYLEIKSARRKIADFYFDHIKLPPDWVMAPHIPGATYSHFVLRVPDRMRVMAQAAAHGVQLGQLIEYSMPHLAAYRSYADPSEFPNSLLCSQTTINLPIHPGLSPQDVEKVIHAIAETVSH